MHIKDNRDHIMAMLMMRPSLGNGIKLDPEAQECIRFADIMRRHTSQGRYKGIWGHIPNEGQRSRLTGAIMRCMGLIAGTTDYYFIWAGGGCVIEFKAAERMGFRKIKGQDQYVKIKAGVQSESQKFFQKWCEYCDIPYCLVYTSEEAEAKLKAFGALV